MRKNREGYLIDGITRECTNCSSMFVLKSKTVTLCNICNSNRVKSQSLELKMWRRAKSRAKDKNIEFTISVSDIIIPEYCPILNIKLLENKGKSGGKQESPSLDRKDNSKGYTKENIMVISHLANCMKASANTEQLRNFAKWVFVNYPVDINEIN